MKHFFEQMGDILENFELAGVLLIVLLLSLIVLNLVVCFCVLSMRKSLKNIAENCGAAEKRIRRGPVQQKKESWLAGKK